MLLDAGMVTVWAGENVAALGCLPKIQYTNKIFESYYGEKTVGVTRHYIAKAHNDKVDMLIQIQRSNKISTTHLCYVVPVSDAEGQSWYKILQVQQVLDEDGLPMTELALQRIEAVDDGAANH